MMHENVMILDLFRASFSKTAMDEIKAMTRPTNAIRVIVFMSVL